MFVKCKTTAGIDVFFNKQFISKIIGGGGKTITVYTTDGSAGVKVPVEEIAKLL